MRKLTVLLVIGAALLASAPADAAGNVKITAHLTADHVYRGGLTYMTGSVKPRGTARVVVQVFDGTRWSDRQAGNVGNDGVYKIGIRPSRAGSYLMRVRSNGGSVISNLVGMAVIIPPRTLLDVTGDTRQTTGYFSAPAEWDINYVYNCANSEFGTTNFSVVVYYSNGEYGDLLVNVVGREGSGSNHVHNGRGTFYLEIGSFCDFHVTLTAPGT